MVNWNDDRFAVTDHDLKLVHDIGKACPEAERVFITGEVNPRFLGDIAVAVLFACNCHTRNALFTGTYYGTIRMTRFQPGARITPVWDELGKKRLEALLEKEAKRLGCRKWTAETGEFYTGVVLSNKLYNHIAKAKKGSGRTPQDEAYLTCVLALGKLTYEDRQRGAFFTNMSFDEFDLVPMTDEQIAERNDVLVKDSKYLTNEEWCFVDDCLDQRLSQMYTSGVTTPEVIPARGLPGGSFTESPLHPDGGNQAVRGRSRINRVKYGERSFWAIAPPP